MLQNSLISRVLIRNFSRSKLSLASRSTMNNFSFLSGQNRHQFNGTQTRFASSSLAKQLRDVLQEEIKTEQELGYNAHKVMPSKIGDFEIEEDGALFRLRKKHEDEKIVVTVNVNNTVNDDEVEDEELDHYEETQKEEDENAPVSLPPLRVDIMKGAHRLVFYIDYEKIGKNEYQFSVDDFTVAPIGKNGKTGDELPEQIYFSSGKYVDQELYQLLFVRYLEERGFTQKFCRELIVFATHYEHLQYVTLLKKLKRFVGGKEEDEDKGK